MFWRLVVLGGVCVLLLGAEGRSGGGRTVTFHRTQRDGSQGQARTRPRRDTSGAFRPSHGPPFTSCRTPLTPAEHEVLDDNTHETGFNGDDGSYVILTWVGDGTGVVLVLSTFSAPIDTFLEGGSSRLYRSTDYGKSFHDISQRINNTFIKEEFGVSVGPGSSVSRQPHTSSTHLKVKVNTPLFPPDLQGGLWLSLDFGAKWTKVHDGERGDLVLKRTKDLGKTFTTIHEDIFSFGYIGAFLFFSVMEDPVRCSSRRISHPHVVSHHFCVCVCVCVCVCLQFYSILDGDEDMLFMHVDNPGDTFFGTMYTSDDRGILFSKSLERHLFDGHRKSDFTNITSLRGVYLTNKLDDDGRIRSVISFNRGGTWRQLSKPENVDCGKQFQRCNLHIHGEHSRNNRIVPMLALSEPTAVGLVIAHGTVGDSLSSSQHPDVFVSSDGGYNWRGTLRGPHHYSILDSGGLIVAVEAQREGQVKTIKFSTDEGRCWKSYNFTEQPFFFAGLASEPGTKAMNVSVWGFRPEEDGQPMWVAVTIDFQSLITRECDEQDYEQWLAHSTDGGGSERNGCVLGLKETYRRLKKQSVCRNGKSFVVSKKQSPCLCTRDDYLCDYGYYPHVNTSECVREPSANKTLEPCLEGEEDELLTAGYRKVASDRCEGGFSPQLAVQTVIRPCGVNTSPAPSARSLSPITDFDTPVSRFVATPVYRFSNLRIQDDENGVTPDLESATSSNGTACQQDSDDVRHILNYFTIFILF
uniref:Si:dkey-159a18.1 n=1 Tax=Sparus aurata TaxID=8175 RepID=A0A671VU90_SPAAU